MTSPSPPAFNLFIILVCAISLAGCSARDPGTASGPCPQPRTTWKAPDFVYAYTNPMPRTPDALQAGRRLYMETSGDVPCVKCHGKNLDGQGKMAALFSPPPRNFTCADTMDDIPDGQLFWIIKYGSPETSMPAFNTLHDEQIWQLVHVIRDAAD